MTEPAGAGDLGPGGAVEVEPGGADEDDAEPVAPGRLPPGLDGARRALAVVAHPDDESFGLGGVLGMLVDHGVAVEVLCLSHGEASSLGARHDLGAVRRRELLDAAAVLGIGTVRLHDLPDGRVGEHEDRIVALVEEALAIGDEPELAGSDWGAVAVVVFEMGGVTGHPDHVAATRAAIAVARRRGATVVEWGIQPSVARTLSDALSAPFSGLAGHDVFSVVVDRDRQRAAAACHHSQAVGNPVLQRRLALQGDVDRVRVTGAWTEGPNGPVSRPRS